MRHQIQLNQQEERQVQPNNNDNQPTTPVMDIQRPTVQAPPQPQPTQQPTVISPSGSVSRPATMEYTRPRTDSTTSPSFAPVAQPFSEQTANSQKIKKSKKGLIIGVFVVLFLGLAIAGGGYYFMVYNKKTEPAPVQNTEPAPATTEPAVVDATPEGVDQTTEQIDQQLNSVDDTQDFTTDDVSDTSLSIQ